MSPDSFPVPPDAWTPADLAAAALLDLGTVPRQPGAVVLVDHLTSLAAASDGLQRRPSDLAKLRRAIGVVVGGLLQRWAKGRAVFRSREKGDFTGELVGFRSFATAVDGLVSLGQVSTKGAMSYAIDFGDGQPGSSRRAARLRPTDHLLALAEEHGIGLRNVAEQFGREFSSRPPAVPPVLAERRPLKEGFRDSRTPATLPRVGMVRTDDETAQRLSGVILEANEFIAGFAVGGCLPPRWHRRTFGPSWLLGGRWTALGSSGVYQGLPKAERAVITINGASTVELDIVASHLSIMHGLLGLPLPEGDLYAIPGVPRAVVKRWITATLGAGRPRVSWPQGAAADQPELRTLKARVVGAAVIGRYPFLADLAEAVADGAGLRDLADLGTPARLLTHRLMGLEAAGMTAAMAELRREGVPALPVHDSLIVPTRHVAAAEGALVAGFRDAAGAAIRTRPV